MFFAYSSVSLSVFGKLHSDFDGIERVTSACFHETSSTTGDQMCEEGSLFTVVVSAHDVKKGKERKIRFKDAGCDILYSPLKSFSYARLNLFA